MKKRHIGLGFRVSLLFVLLLVMVTVVFTKIGDWKSTNEAANWNKTSITNYGHILNSVLKVKVKKAEKGLASMIYADEVASFVGGDRGNANSIVLSGFFLTLERTADAECLFLLDTTYAVIFSEHVEKHKIGSDFNPASLCKKAAETWAYEGGPLVSNNKPHYIVVTPLTDMNDVIVGYVGVSVALTKIIHEFSTILQGNSAILSGGEIIATSDTTGTIETSIDIATISTGSVVEVGEEFHKAFLIPLTEDREDRLLFLTDITGEYNQNNVIDKQSFTYKGVALVVALIVTLIMLHFITRSLGYVTRTILDIQNTGDLTKRVHHNSSDEIGILADTFNKFIETLSHLIHHVKDSSVEIGSLLQQISDFAEHLNGENARISKESSEISEKTKDISNHLLQVSDESKINAEHIQSIASVTAELSSSVSSVADSCNNELDIAIDANNRVERVSNLITSLNERLNTISEYSDSIVTIAKETTLLAINASVEAARAGTAGKGFAVVAEEVKKLAAQTTQVSKEITQQIEALQEQSGSTVDDMSHLSETLGDIKQISTQINHSVAEQDSGLVEVAGKTEETNGFITKLNSTISSVSYELSSAVEVLDGIRQNMQICRADSDNLMHQIEGFQTSYDELERTVSQFTVDE